MAVHSLEHTIRRFSGALCVRVIDACSAHNPVHSHDWPILSLYVMGRQTKIHECGEDVIAGPGAVLHRAEAPHANWVGAMGLEQLDIQFDPRWLLVDWANLAQQPVHCWVGGEVGAASRVLAAEWSCGDRSEEELIEQTRSFLQHASRCPMPKRPQWLDVATRYADEASGPVDTKALAGILGLHPAWLTQAYRAATGEGLQETAQRRRITRAVNLLRGSSIPCAQVAAEAGFCDQSHMIRAFNRLLGRTPLAVRVEAAALGVSCASAF